VGGSSLDQLGTSAAASSFTNTQNRLRHTPTTDFQPPYFPPPYSMPQQPVDFPHHHVNPDPYAHLNHYGQAAAAAAHHQQAYGVNTDRHHLLGQDPLGNGGLPRAFPGYDTRRSEYDPVPRPDVLIPSRGPHDLHNPLLLQGSTGIPGLDDTAGVSTPKLPRDRFINV
jgi:transcription factor AP-2 alpha/beta